MSRRRARISDRKPSLPYLDIPYKKEVRNPWPPYQIAGPERIAEIHDMSMRILEKTGMRFMDEEAMDLWEKAGAKVDRETQHVWPHRELIEELVAKAPFGVYLSRP